MIWTKHAEVETNTGVFDFASFPTTTVFRGAQSLFAWNDEPELRWNLPLEEDSLFGLKAVLAAGDTAVSLIDRGSTAPAILVGLDPETGEEKWRREDSYFPSGHGLAACCDDVFLHGMRKAGDRGLLRLEAETGELLEERDALPGRGIYSTGDRIILHAETNGLFVADKESESWTNIFNGAVADLTANSTQICFIAPDRESWEVVSLQPNGQQFGKAPLGVSQSYMVAPADRSNLVALFGPTVLRIFDMSGPGELWDYQASDGEEVTAAAWTPHGLAVAIQPGGAPTRTQLLDPESGTVLEELPFTGRFASYLYWCDDRLVTGGFTKMESLQAL